MIPRRVLLNAVTLGVTLDPALRGETWALWCFWINTAFVLLPLCASLRWSWQQWGVVFLTGCCLVSSLFLPLTATILELSGSVQHVSLEGDRFPCIAVAPYLTCECVVVKGEWECTAWKTPAGCAQNTDCWQL